MCHVHFMIPLRKQLRSRKQIKIDELIYWAKKRSIRDGRDFNITAADIDWRDKCPCCGNALTYGVKGRGTRSNQSASLDRIDPSGGYVKGNVQVLCWRCNAVKRDASYAELKRIVAFLELYYY